jgi:hypothetical protein
MPLFLLEGLSLEIKLSIDQYLVSEPTKRRGQDRGFLWSSKKGRNLALKLQRRCKGFQEATINFHLHPSITIAFVHTVAHPLKRKENNSSFDQPVDFSYPGIMPHHTPWNTRMQHTMQIKGKGT